MVRGGEALGDLLQAGKDGETGGDTLKVEGTAALTLPGFDTLVNGIAHWSGNGKAVIGTGAANRFDLSGLTSVAGLLSLQVLPIHPLVPCELDVPSRWLPISGKRSGARSAGVSCCCTSWLTSGAWTRSPAS